MNETATAAPAVDRLQWSATKDKYRRPVKELRTARNHTIGVVVTLPKVYVEQYGYRYLVNCWELPVFNADGTPNKSSDKLAEFNSLAEAKAHLVEVVERVAKAKIDEHRQLVIDQWARLAAMPL